mmetsp:Transcript_80230/g.129992  ORF Transcript_80230/g.129992 Transcript_80230/m.129992 type:complete len:208 (+) Transcript_80230:606-1229(+)
MATLLASSTACMAKTLLAPTPFAQSIQTFMGFVSLAASSVCKAAACSWKYLLMAGTAAGVCWLARRTVQCTCGVVTIPRSCMLPPAAATPEATSTARWGELTRVSRPTTTSPGATEGVGEICESTASTVAMSPALARSVATFSQSAASMPPSGSTILLPLSAPSLWDAVTITPTILPVCAARRAAKAPTRYMITSIVSALARKPAVP